MMIRAVIGSSRLANGVLRSPSFVARKQQLALATQNRYQSTAENHSARAAYEDNFHKEIVQAYTHNPIEGYIRNSPYETVAVPNMPLDQYVWQHLPKWSNHIATVSF